jgi:protein-tyrosine phosphatase
MVARLTQAELDVIAHGPAGRRWLLLEGSLDGLDSAFSEAADELRQRGFAVLVAHPERGRRTGAAGEAISHEVASGSVLQLTAHSVAGLGGKRVQTSAWALLHSTPAAVVIASDAHGPSRAPAMRPALGALVSRGILDPRRFLADLPRELLDHGLEPRPLASVA